MGQSQRRRVCFVQFARWQHRGEVSRLRLNIVTSCPKPVRPQNVLALNNKTPPNGRGEGHVIHFHNFCPPPVVSLVWTKIGSSNLVCRLIVATTSVGLCMRNYHYIESLIGVLIKSRDLLKLYKILDVVTTNH